MKEKCLDAKYRTTAFSDRPSVNDLDLELRSACPRIILQDIDSTSKVEPGGWKRINTLAHYNVFFLVFVLYLLFWYSVQGQLGSVIL